MKVKGLLETKGTEVFSLDARKSVEDAIRLMHSRNISAVVVNEKKKPVGIFTERDVVRCYIGADGKLFSKISLHKAMTKHLIVAELEDELSSIMSVMVEKNIRHLPVVHGGKVIGMLSVRDIIQSRVEKLTSEIHYLKDYIIDS
jgi:IMP dehydrogenase